MEKRTCISVILPLKLDWEPCYFARPGIRTGDRVKVAFAGKTYSGVVSRTDICPDISPVKIKDILETEAGIAPILESEIMLWRKVAEYYMCSVGEVYKAAYPHGKINLEEARAQARQKVCDRRERTLNAIISRLEKLQARLDKKTEQAARAKDETKSKATLLTDIEKITKEIQAGIEAKICAENSLKAAQEGLTISPAGELKDGITLSESQRKAYEEIKKGFDSGKPVLLHGVTGSGKTEIYLKLAHEVFKKGKNVLYLVPEIALSRQLEDRLYEHFTDRLIVFHSAESTASRRNAAEMIRNSRSEGYILLGTRSSLFLPHHDLGLIIVDEEHDPSYKQDSPAPRYNGRDTALMLNQLNEGCRIILGSATPSLEELYNTATGKHTLVRLTSRYHGCEDADIEIIDTKAERRKNGMVGTFSRKLIDRIRQTLAEGGQIMLLRSRRAWAGAMQCVQCGEIQKCPHCNVSMSYHKTTGMMVCHYCGYNSPYTGTCSKCSGTLIGLGSGTQKVEEEAAGLFPEARIARLDSDSAQNKSFEANTIKEFAKGNIDILIGTQMVTKGFDFGNVSLTAIIAADTLLGIQDFRADEKALHLIEQFRGRSGRRGEKGTLVIQTSQPDHPIYRMLDGSSDITGSSLMTERKDFGFPPYSRIIELTVRDLYEDRADRMSSRLVAGLNRIFTTACSTSLLSAAPVTGPYRPVIDKVGDQHIRKIRISLNKDRLLSRKKSDLKNMLEAFEKENRYTGHITIDVDPA